MLVRDESVGHVIVRAHNAISTLHNAKEGTSSHEIVQGTDKGCACALHKKGFLHGFIPPTPKAHGLAFFSPLRLWRLFFFVFHGGGLPCSSRGRQSCRRVASARAAETRGEREAPGTAPREDPLARAIASRLRAPASRLRAQASNTHTHNKGGEPSFARLAESETRREKKFSSFSWKRTTVVFLAFLSRSPFVWSPGV